MYKGYTQIYTDTQGRQCSQRSVDRDVGGDSPTLQSLDLLIEILGKRFIIPVTTVRADPMTLALHVLTVLMSHLLSWADSDDQRSYWERTQIGFTVSIKKRNSSRHVLFLSVLGVLSALGSGRSVCSLVGGDGVLTQLASLGDSNTVLQRPGADLGVLLTLDTSGLAGAARLALVSRCTTSTASVFDVRRESLVELVCMLLREIDDVVLTIKGELDVVLGKREAPESIASPEPLSLFLCHSY